MPLLAWNPDFCLPLFSSLLTNATVPECTYPSMSHRDFTLTRLFPHAWPRPHPSHSAVSFTLESDSGGVLGLLLLGASQV